MPVVIKWNPTRNMFALEDAINQVLDQISDCMPGRGKEKKSAWVPVADMYETDKAIVIEIELAEIDKNSLEILYQEANLLIRGERPFSDEMQSGKIHRIERMYGTFQRVFWVPVPVNAHMISASYERGVLQITLVKLKTDQVKVPITFK